MKSNYPNDDEIKKLKKMGAFYRTFPVYGVCLSLAPLTINSLLKNHPVVQLALYTIVFVAIIYLLLNFALLKRCPRCRAWGTPVLRGSCARCGLHLDPSAVKPEGPV